jgi:hypothetical protein
MLFYVLIIQYPLHFVILQVEIFQNGLSETETNIKWQNNKHYIVLFAAGAAMK